MADNEAVLLHEDEEEKITLIECKQVKTNIAFRVVKRIIDIVAGLVGVILLIPITALVWIVRIIKKENTGPLFYEQLRIGKNGKQFRMYKFRSMCMNADEKLKTYLAENEEARKEYKKYKKLKNDPRITKVGCFLRKTSIDEFPQFINVLFGSMSLVGPRPYLPREKEDMGEYYSTIVKVKPGLTGPWQVAGRSNLKFEDRMKLDIDYVKNMSLKKDIKMVWKTVTKVFKKDGAI